MSFLPLRNIVSDFFASYEPRLTMPCLYLCLSSRLFLHQDKAKGAAPRFEIKKWNAVAMWSWDICADTVRLLVSQTVVFRSSSLTLFPQCAICRNSLNEPSIEYQANPSPTNDNGLSIAFGNCGTFCGERSAEVDWSLCSLGWHQLVCSLSHMYLFLRLSLSTTCFYTQATSFT